MKQTPLFLDEGWLREVEDLSSHLSTEVNAGEQRGI